MDETTQTLKDYLSLYSLEDLLRSFFVMNLWLPNIACPIKIQYLYAALESIHKSLPTEAKIKSYEDFESFCKDLIALLPSFTMLEDYVPESDWGEIKYFLENKIYKVFYGADLSNQYDYYYSFEILHLSFDKYYSRATGRSALKEFEFSLKLQDHIITNITQTKKEDSEITPGDIEIPSREFWVEANQFLDQFSPESHVDPSLIDEYTRDLDLVEGSPWLTMEQFNNKAYTGTNCPYYFFKTGGRYFPVMPRKYFSVLYDRWGRILKENFEQIKREEKNLEIGIGIQLYRFMRDRVGQDEIYGLVSPLDENKKPCRTTFAAAVRSRDRLFLIHVVPPPIVKTELDNYLEQLGEELREVQELLSTFPTRLGLWAEEKIVEFRSKRSGEVLTPFFLIVVPIYLTSDIFSFSIPRDFPGEVISLDQIAGIIDELKDSDELSDFFDFLDEIESISMPAIISYLDKFGAFRDSSGILIPGAKSPNMMLLSTNWGSDFRYRSLSGFWRIFPDVNFFGDPRSWLIREHEIHPGGFSLQSRVFRGYAYGQRVGNTTFFTRIPMDMMDFERAKIADLVMQMIIDALAVYQNKIQKLSFCGDKNRIQIYVYPISLVSERLELRHLSHLEPINELWSSDITRIKTLDYAIRIVYDDQKVASALPKIEDRSLQINLLINILGCIDAIWNDKGLTVVKKHLIAERGKSRRFKVFRIKKEVSFPEVARPILPGSKNHKLAERSIAQIADALGLTPGKYELEDAKSKLNQLRSTLVGSIERSISKYNLAQAIPLLIGNIDALSNEYEIRCHEIEEAFDQEVEYIREGKYSKERTKFLVWHKNYRYLIEKFIQLQPNSDQEFTTVELQNLLAFVDRIHHVYSASDIIHYGIYPVAVTIDSDILVSVEYGKDIQSMQKEFSKEQAQIELEIIGNKDHVPELGIPLVDYLDEVDKAFNCDFGFGFRDMINVQQVLGLWAEYNSGATENSYYSANSDEIAEACSLGIRDFDLSNIGKILELLTLKPEEMLKIVGDPIPANDLPVWEYRKRPNRYSIRPLIKIGDKFIWGPYSIRKSGLIWSYVPHTHRLPADMVSPTVLRVLGKGHRRIENSLQMKIKEVATTHSQFVETNVYLHRLDPGIANIGDCDVLVYLKEKNFILNIESKIVDAAYCLKDSKRSRDKIFGRTKTDGSFRNGYLQQVEKRDAYLKKNYPTIMDKLNWEVPNNPLRIVSLFVTQSGLWWTKFPPIDTEVIFIEIRLLDNLIKIL